MKALLRATVCSFVLVGAIRAENIVEEGELGAPLPPVTLDTAAVEAWLRPPAPPPASAPTTASARRIAAKLDAHVAELVRGWPWQPFHHVLGISGYEVCFDHPDELFHALAIAWPFLTEPTRRATADLLARELDAHPPYAVEGYDHTAGRARESYDVPAALRSRARGKARSIFGVAAFEEYMRRCAPPERAALVRAHWPRLVARVQPLLESGYPFDPARRGETRDGAERLNGDLAGLLAFARLAGDAPGSGTVVGQPVPAAARGAAVQAARFWPARTPASPPAAGTDCPTTAPPSVMTRLRELAELRLNLERVNPRFVEATASASKGLHNFKLARYCGLTPEVTAVLPAEERALAAARLRAFREARPAWHLALGDRMIGGENYTNPMHFGRALFAGAALIERLPATELEALVDVPACRADLNFIERCALALGAGAK